MPGILLFCGGVVVILAASWLLVSRLERLGERAGFSEAWLALAAVTLVPYVVLLGMRRERMAGLRLPARWVRWLVNGTISQASRQQLQRGLDLEATRLSEQR